jgi:hypothetical protein
VYYPNEVASLIFGFIAAVIILLLFRKKDLPRFRLIFTAFLFILAANFFTVAEGFLLPELLNILEHVSYALAGLLFTALCWSMVRTRG